MTSRELLKNIYDRMMMSKSKIVIPTDNSADFVLLKQIEGAEETLREVFKRMHEEGILDVDHLLIRACVVKQHINEEIGCYGK